MGVLGGRVAVAMGGVLELRRRRCEISSVRATLMLRYAPLVLKDVSVAATCDWVTGVGVRPYVSNENGPVSSLCTVQPGFPEVEHHDGCPRMYIEP